MWASQRVSYWNKIWSLWPSVTLYSEKKRLERIQDRIKRTYAGTAQEFVTQKNIAEDFLSPRHIFTYGLDGLFVQRDFDVEIFQVIVGRGRLLILSAGALMHGLPPCTIHLIVLLGILALGPTSVHLLLLLLLHLLHALHLHCGLFIVLLLHPGLLLPVLLGLHLLPLCSGHLLLLLVLLATILVVVLLLATTGGGIGRARGPGGIRSHSIALCLMFTFNLKN